MDAGNSDTDTQKKTSSNGYFLMFSYSAEKKHCVQVDKNQFPLEPFILIFLPAEMAVSSWMAVFMLAPTASSAPS